MTPADPATPFAATEASGRPVIQRAARPSSGAVASKRRSRGSKVKVLHVISGLGPGGAETVLYRIATNSRLVRHEVICLGKPDWYSGLLEDSGINVHHVDCTSLSSIIRNWFTLHRLIKASDADVVQSWMYRANLLAGLSGRMAGKRVLWNIRCSTVDSLRPASRMLARLGGLLARWVPTVIVNCSAQSMKLHSGLGYDAVEAELIPNGFDSDVFCPDDATRAQTRASLGVPSGAFLIGSIGRWHPQKGFPILLEAIRLARERRVPLVLLLAGRGLDSENRELARLALQNGLEQVLLPIGHRADVANIGRALDLHVLASVGAEGFPNVVAETMLLATPNVATDIGDAALIVGDTGWVVPARDPQALARAVEEAYREWSNQPSLWAHRRAEARRRISESFSLEQMIAAYEALWRRVA